MEELEALNLLLRATGSNPVSDLGAEHPDVANAQVTLDRVRRKAQKKGWWFNIDYDVTFQPDPTTKEIVIAKEITKFVGDRNLHVVRGGKLYNKINQTFQFEGNVTAHRVQRTLDWDDLPESMQEHIQYLAAKEFVRDEIEDPQKEASYEKDAAIAMMEVKSEDLEQSQFNSFNKSRVARARLGVQPYSRGTGRFFGNPDV